MIYHDKICVELRRGRDNPAQLGSIAWLGEHHYGRKYVLMHAQRTHHLKASNQCSGLSSPQSSFCTHSRRSSNS